MKYWISIVIILFSGCYFKYPLYHDSDLIEVPEIAGTWGGEDKKITLTFIKHQPKEYWLYFNYSDSAKSPEHFIAKFLRLDGILFMDLEYGKLDDYTHASSKFDGHIIWKANVDSSALILVEMNSDYLVQLAQEKKIKIDYVMTQAPRSDPAMKAEYMITEKTDKLQELIKKYCNDPNVFPDKDITALKKIK